MTALPSRSRPPHGVLAAPLDRLLPGGARSGLLATAHGRVLEIGAGTGANLPWYPTSLDGLDLCEADLHLRRRLEQRVAGRSWPFPVTVHEAPPEGPFPSDSYDTIVSTLVLCSAPDPAATTTAVRSVLAEGGRVAYIEHVHAGGALGRLQTHLSPTWGRLAGGCRLDRPPTSALRSAGLVPVEQQWLRLPPPFLLAVAGQAIVRVRPSPSVPS